MNAATFVRLTASACCLAALFAGSASAQTLTILSGYPEMTPFYQRVADSMKTTHPDLKIDVQAIPLREHEKRVALSLSSGSKELFVVELPGSTANRYIQNDLLSAAPPDMAAFVTDAKNFNAFFRDAASVGGKVYGVPLFRGQGALFYNTEMFKAAGIAAPPATMADYDAAAAKLTKRNGDAIDVTGWSLRLSGGGQGIAEKFWINMFQHNGALMIEEKTPGKWRVNLANEAGVKTLKQYLNNLYVSKTVTVDAPADADAFQRGKTAMFIRESWVIGDNAKKAPKLDYATALMPYGTIALPVNLYVNGDAKTGKAGWDFAMAANKPENLVWLLDNIGWLPNRGGVDYSAVTKAKPAFGAFVNMPEKYAFFTLPAIGPVEEVLTRIAAQLVTAFADAKLATDDKAIQAKLKVAEDEANEILKREGILAP